MVVLALATTGCAITRVSVSSSGTEGSKASSNILGLTDDGRYTLFLSQADNLVPGDTNGTWDVFRHDSSTGATVLVDVADNGAKLAAGAYDGALSADGRYAAFATSAALDPGDTNDGGDVYLRDLAAGSTTWVSQPPPSGLPPGGVFSSQTAQAVMLSGDGRFVSFIWRTNSPTGGTALYRRDRIAGTTTMLTESAQIGPVIGSPDARHYVVQTGCLQGACLTHPRFVDTDGSAAAWPAVPFADCAFSSVAAISATGRYLVYASAGGLQAPCLERGVYLVDRTTATATRLANLGPVAGVNRDASAILFIADGAHLPNGTSGRLDLYLRDVATGADRRVGIGVTGEEPNADVISAMLSDDGHALAFVSAADNLVPGDDNGVDDVFVRPAS